MFPTNWEDRVSAWTNSADTGVKKTGALSGARFVQGCVLRVTLISAISLKPRSRLCSTLSRCDPRVSRPRLRRLWPRRECLWNGRCQTSLCHDRAHHCGHSRSGCRFRHGREPPFRHDRCSVHYHGRCCWRCRDRNRCDRHLYRRRGHRHYHHRFRRRYHHHRHYRRRYRPSHRRSS